MGIIKPKSSTQRIDNPKNWTNLKANEFKITQFLETHILEYLSNFNINYIICKNVKNFKFKLFQKSKFLKKNG